jgi:hypothetical protein
MPAMESTGGAFAPRSTRTQTPMAPQARFNMPSVGSRPMTPGVMTPGTMPSMGAQSMRPPTTPQPGMTPAIRTTGALRR